MKSKQFLNRATGLSMLQMDIATRICFFQGHIVCLAPRPDLLDDELQEISDLRAEEIVDLDELASRFGLYVLRYIKHPYPIGPFPDCNTQVIYAPSPVRWPFRFSHKEGD